MPAAVSMKALLEAGVHFGHQTRRWNPKMRKFIFAERNGIHIIDLEQTVDCLEEACRFVADLVAAGHTLLFVGTKRQAQDKVAEAAARCGQYYVNHRWLGGMMTNWKTISVSIKRLKELEGMLGEENSGRTKKELLQITRERDKLERAMGGIKEMGDLPNILVVIDTNREKIAVAEANKLGIPVVAVLDSNSDPAGITYPIPGNDDALRAIELYCTLVSDSVLDGIQQEMLAAGVDVGAADQAPSEVIDEGAMAGREIAAAPEAEKGAKRGRAKAGERKAPTVERKRTRAVKSDAVAEKDPAGV